MKTIRHNGTATIISNTQDAITAIKAISAKSYDNVVLLATIQLLAEKINADLHDIWARLDLMVH